MNKLTSTAVLSAVALGLSGARSARAAGTALDVQSARGTGMAGAVTAMIDDSSAIYYNPAGIAQGRIIDAQIGDTLIIPSYRYTTPGGASTNNSIDVVPPVNAYVAAGITDYLSAGIGVFTPFGSTVNWPDEWVGKSQITSSQLSTYDINPTAACHFGRFRLGVGLQIVRATVDLKQKIETGTTEASSELGAGAWGVGANVGVQVDAVPKYLALGLHYRSAVTLDFDGNAHFGNVPPELQGSIHDQPVSTTLVNPDSLAMAVASHPIPALVLDAEAVWFGWSKFHSITIDFPNDRTQTLNRTEIKNWNNTVNVRLGGEFAIDDAWRVRLGVLYDPSPSPADTLEPDIPDADRLNLAVGGSYVHPSGFRVDLGYQFLVLFKRTSTAPQLPGTYSGIVDIVGLSIGYRTPSPARHANDAPVWVPVDSTSPPPAPPPLVPAPAPAGSPAPGAAPPPIDPSSTPPAPAPFPPPTN